MSFIRLFNHDIRTPFLLLALFDAAICFGALYLAAYMRFFSQADPIIYTVSIVGPLELRAALFASVIIFTMLGLGLFQAQRRETIWNILGRIAVSFIISSLIVTIVFYIVPDFYLGRGVFAIFLVFSFLGISLSHYLFEIWIDQGALVKKVVVLGAGKKADWVNRLRRKADRRGIKICGFIRLNDEEVVVQEDKVIDLDQPLDEYVIENDIEEIVVAISERRNRFPAKELINCRLSGVDVIELPTFLERQMAKVYIELLEPSLIIFSNGFRQGYLKSFGSRVLDLFASSVLLLLMMPVMLITAICIWWENDRSGPVLYRQTRVGQGNHNFELLKFRSMAVNAEAGTGAQWASADDQRVTKVGKIIRKYRVDELPQILNIFKGEMSLVGPRPERPEFVEQLSEKIPFYNERHRVKPGLAGWAQIKYPYGSSEEDALEKLKFDLFYVKNSNLIFDIAILLQVAEIVLWGKGAR